MASLLINSNENWPMSKMRLHRITCFFCCCTSSFFLQPIVTFEWNDNLTIMSSRSQTSQNTIPFGPIKYLSIIKCGFREFDVFACECVCCANQSETEPDNFLAFTCFQYNWRFFDINFDFQLRQFVCICCLCRI